MPRLLRHRALITTCTTLCGKVRVHSDVHGLFDRLCHVNTLQHAAILDNALDHSAAIASTSTRTASCIFLIDASVAYICLHHCTTQQSTATSRIICNIIVHHLQQAQQHRASSATGATTSCIICNRRHHLQQHRASSATGATTSCIICNIWKYVAVVTVAHLAICCR